MQTSQVAYSAKMIFGNFSWQRDRLLGLGMASRLVSFGLGVSVFSFSVVLVVSVGSVLCTGVVSGLFRLSSQGKWCLCVHPRGLSCSLPDRGHLFPLSVLIFYFPSSNIISAKLLPPFKKKKEQLHCFLGANSMIENICPIVSHWCQHKWIHLFRN